MEERIKQLTFQNQLIEKGDRIVIGVSGGADSICLLQVLDSLKDEYELGLHVVHVNHGLRGREADEDEAYVQVVCQELGLPFHVYHIDVAQVARDEGLSTEEAGRNVRYQAFLTVCKEENCNKIAIAHNENDNAETVLFHLIRGTGLRGLTGIKPSRTVAPGIEIIRPLLQTTREEIEEYLHQRGRAYQTDATNLTDDYSRNKVRNQVLRYMKEEINDRVVEHIAGTANQLKEIEDFIKDCVNAAYDVYVETDSYGRVCIKESLQKEHIVLQKGIIRNVLEQLMTNGLKDLEARHLELILQMFDWQVNKKLCLPGGLTVIRGYETIYFQNELARVSKEYNKSVLFAVPIQEPCEYYLEEIGKTLKVEFREYEKSMIIPKNAYTKWFDYDKINHTVLLRTRAAGDYIQVHASGGSKKLKDYFIDRKIAREERNQILLLADGSHIMWILGDRISEKYKVSSATKKILVISLIGGN